jgi:hypothetical protein
VPFFILSSDDSSRTVLRKDMSGFNFLRGAASWMGIEANGLDAYDFSGKASDHQVKVFNGDGAREFVTLKDDPA